MSKLGTAKAQGSITVPGTLVVVVTALVLVAFVVVAKLMF
jgi:hypothetical protein